MIIHSDIYCDRCFQYSTKISYSFSGFFVSFSPHMQTKGNKILYQKSLRATVEYLFGAGLGGESVFGRGWFGMTALPLYYSR